ncbi:MAG: phosphopantothenoylcysteine decarboxylase [Candidatus Omnitrophota bacterium]
MRILITAGPTREFIDPVRYISNLSTGNMGYAIARRAKNKKHKVTLVSGPVGLKPPEGIRVIECVSANDMFRAVKKEFKKTDCLVMSAAVSDFRPEIKHKEKIKKQKPPNGRKLALVQTPDILAWAGKNKADKTIVGFCLETSSLTQNAKRKLEEKNADIIVANQIDKNFSAFGFGKTKVLVIGKGGSVEKIGPSTKEKIAEILLERIEKLWHNGRFAEAKVPHPEAPGSGTNFPKNKAVENLAAYPRG